MKESKKKSKIGVSEIAEMLGISKSTVSRALNNHPKISNETKDKVKKAAIKLGYTPNIPDFMIPDKTKAISVIVPDINDSYIRDIISGVESFFNEKGYDVLISNTSDSPEKVDQALELTKNMDISGVILFVFDKNFTGDTLMSLKNVRIPFVLIHEGDKDITAGKVIPDILQGTIKATQHLITYDNKKIALLLHSDNNTVCSEMLSGYRYALQEAGITVSDKLVKYRNTSTTRINKSLNELFSEDEFPDAIITRSPLAAFQSINYLKSKNLEVPGDVMVVSLGTETFSSFCSPGLASIQLNGHETGIDASKLLFENIISLNAPPKTIVRPVHFIIKGSAMRRRRTGEQ